MIDYHRLVILLRTRASVRTWQKIDDADRSEAWPSRRMIYAVEPTDETTLFVFAHECGHVALNHPDLSVQGKAARHEYDATQWAFSALRRLGVRVSPDIVRFAKECLAGYVETDLECGHVPLRIRFFVRGVKPAYAERHENRKDAGE